MAKFSLFSNDLGVDLGTSNVLIYADGKGLVVREPCVVAVDKNTGKILQVGAAARNMLGRTPGNLVSMKPLKGGVICDHEMTVRLLQAVFRRATQSGLFTPKPRLVVSVPSGITEVEERTVINAAIEALVENGWQVGVITWASKGIDWGEELNNIGNIKFNWLCRYFPALADGKFACIPYGYNKAKYLTGMNDSHLYHLAYLVDDNKEVRADWRKFGEMRWEEGFRCKFKTIDASRSFHRAIEGLVL